MSVGLVIVSHGGTADSLVAEAEFVVGGKLDRVWPIAFNHSEGHREELVRIHQAIEKADSGDGVLVLTDLVGSSPSNLVVDLLPSRNAVLVTGITLAMLLSVWNYRGQPLGMLARKAVDSGRRSIKIFQS